jgi:hypothetical protein
MNPKTNESSEVAGHKRVVENYYLAALQQRTMDYGMCKWDFVRGLRPAHGDASKGQVVGLKAGSSAAVSYR